MTITDKINGLRSKMSSVCTLLLVELQKASPNQDTLSALYDKEYSLRSEILSLQHPAK